MQALNKRIPVTILTGFLGSGKTTLLNRILGESHGKRIAVIENEFGEVSIDDALLADARSAKSESGASTVDIFKMKNGCLCCTVNGDLVATLNQLAKRSGDFDYLVIETTGIANPAPVVQTFLANEDIAENFVIDSVVTLVDAKHILTHISSVECQEQVAFADMLVLNKTDLVDAKELANVTKVLRTLNVMAPVYRTARGAVDINLIFDQDSFMQKLSLQKHEGCSHGCDHEHSHDHAHHEHAHSHAHDHGHECGAGCNHDHHHDHSHELVHETDVQSVGFEFGGVLNAEAFNTWFGRLIQEHGDRIFRCKGLLEISGRPKQVVVQTVHRVVEVAASNTDSGKGNKNMIVFIGKDLDRQELWDGVKSCLQSAE